MPGIFLFSASPQIMLMIFTLIIVFLINYSSTSSDNSSFFIGSEPLRIQNSSASYNRIIDELVHYKLEKYLMSNYNNHLIPKRMSADPIQVFLSISLYQIIEVNEPQQYILLNTWVIERWKDEVLFWDPDEFNGLSEIVLPRNNIWIPDTTLYNSVVMDDAESRRILNVKVTALPSERTTLVEMLYPTLYKFSCTLNLRFFPYDVHKCKMTFGSWTHDSKNIDYFPFEAEKKITEFEYSEVENGRNNMDEDNCQKYEMDGFRTEHCIENEGWNLLATEVIRCKQKFYCCPNNYTLLNYYLYIQRKPLFYLMNLIMPTSAITLISLVGFFSSSTVNDVREEKISLGITTLLSMSILIFMVSDQMPSTSAFVPLIAWFYTSMMSLIGGGTLAASFVIYIQKKGIIGKRPSSRTMRLAQRLGKFILMEMPLLMKQAYILKSKQDKLIKRQQILRQQLEKQRRQEQADALSLGTKRKSIWQNLQKPSMSNSIRSGSSISALASLGTNSANWLYRYNESMLGPSIHKSSTPIKEENESCCESSSTSSISESEDKESNESNNVKKQSPSTKKSKLNGSVMNNNQGEEQTDHRELNKKVPDLSSKCQIDCANDNNDNPLANAAVLKPLSRLAATMGIDLDRSEGEQDLGERTRRLEQMIVALENSKRRPSQSVPSYRRSTCGSSADLFSTAEFFAPNGDLDSEKVHQPQIQRNLAEIEYDWLAAVIERLFLISFLTMFFLTSFGINGIGVYHYWYYTSVDSVIGS